MLPPSPPEPVDSLDGDSSQDDTIDTSPYRDRRAASPSKTVRPAPSPLFIPPPRTRSPLAKTHLRSRSYAGSPAPCMMRAHSSPGLDSRGRYIFAGVKGKQEIPFRRPSPLRTSSSEDSVYQITNGLNIAEPISEQPELQSGSSSPQHHLDMNSMSGSLSPGIHNTFPRLARRRPSSPLNPTSIPGAGSYRSTSPSPSQQSLVMSTRFNEPYPVYSLSSSSSMPSTPSSIRSRSPSISSLETIPDIPDAEAAAIEADRIAKLKAAADRADESASNNDMIRRRNIMDIHSPTARFGLNRKRWSVCGAEGRQDLDLETIWED